MSEYICSNCGNTNFNNETIDKVFNINGVLTLVENIPALVCSSCQESILTIETTEHIRLLLHGNSTPKKHISTGVFEYV